MSEKKTLYKIRNWNAYNKALIQRGAVNLWFDPEQLENWMHKRCSLKRGRPFRFSNAAIECMAALRYRYALPLRATEGFTRSLFELAGFDPASVQVPSYTTLCRRQRGLDPHLQTRLDGAEAVHLLIDSTGLKVFGDGEWKVRQHGPGRRRQWRKLHLGIDAKTQQIVACSLTENVVADATVGTQFALTNDLEIEEVGADGAYDTWECRCAIAERDARASIPPREGSTLDKGRHGKAGEARDEALWTISKKGRAEWKKSSGYHRRSLVETAMFRFKKCLGGEMRSKEMKNQIVEALIKSRILNQFTQQGMPDSYKVTV